MEYLIIHHSKRKHYTRRSSYSKWETMLYGPFKSVHDAQAWANYKGVLHYLVDFFVGQRIIVVEM